jgi:hypothetical protein
MIDPMGEPLAEYVVDCLPGGGDLGAQSLRLCLRLFEDVVSEFECDIPESDSSSTEVAQAAATLLGVARWPDRHPAATGVLKVGDALVWDAFVAFAPHALDGSVWTRGDGRPFVSFADQGTSIVVRLDSDQAQLLSDDLVAPAQLVPVKEWDRRPRRDRA